jgi:hypothetical protein
MSSFPEKVWDGSQFLMVSAGNEEGYPVVNAVTAAWHQDFLRRAHAMGYQVIQSVSYEIFSEWANQDWVQRAFDDTIGYTGYIPPSYLLSPCNADAMAWVQQAMIEFATLASNVDGMPIHIQVGEPWWWLQPQTRKPCIYDLATREAFNAATGLFAADVGTVDAPAVGTPHDELKLFVQDQLGLSVRACRAAVKAVFPAAEVTVLPFLPTILENAYTAVINLPTSHYAYPNFERFMTEAYDYITGHVVGDITVAMTYPLDTLGYPPNRVQYLGGLVPEVPLPGDTREEVLRRIFTNLSDFEAYGIEKLHFWAYTLVMRDEVTYLERWFYYEGSGHKVAPPGANDADADPNSWTESMKALNGYGEWGPVEDVVISVTSPPAPVWGDIPYGDGNRAVSMGAANGKLYMSAWNPLQQQFYRSDDAGLTFPQVGTIPGGAGSGNHWSPVAYSPSLGRLVIVDQFTSNAAYSDDDGANWTVVNVSVLGPRLWAVVWSPVLNLFIAGGGGPGQIPSNIYTSPTGAVWTSRGNSVTYVAALWCSGFNGGAGQALMISEGTARRSSDGTNWTSQAFGVAAAALDAAYSPALNLVVVVGIATFGIRTSSDGVTWTSRAFPAGYWPIAVVWDDVGARFVVSIVVANTYAATGTVLTSPDGLTWTQENIPAPRRVFTFAASGGVIVGADGLSTGLFEPNSAASYLRWGV